MRRRRKVYRALVTGSTEQACEHKHTTPEAAAECGASLVRDVLVRSHPMQIGYRVEFTASRFMWFAYVKGQGDRSDATG